MGHLFEWVEGDPTLVCWVSWLPNLVGGGELADGKLNSKSQGDIPLVGEICNVLQPSRIRFILQ